MLSSKAKTLSRGASCCAGKEIDDSAKAAANMRTVKVKGLLRTALCIRETIPDFEAGEEVRARNE